MKKNWKEKEKLSRFALDREIAIHGEPVVKLRERNWKHREAGQKTPTKKKQPRHLYELEKAAQHDEQVRAFAKEHKAKLVELTRRVEGHTDKEGNLVQEGQKARHMRHRELLRWCHEERDRRTKAATAKKTRNEVRRIRQDYDQPWKELLNQQEADRHAFRKNETTLLGRAYNILRYTDWKVVFTAQKDANDKSASMFSRAFNALSSSGKRKEVLAKRQQDQQLRLRAKQREQEKLAKVQLQAEQAKKLEANKEAYVRKSESMKDRQAATKQAIRLEQQELTRERNAELRAYRERVKALKQQRTQENVDFRNHEQEKQIDLATEANRAFTVPEEHEDHSGDDGQSTSAPNSKPKRTRKRKDPSERTNRRHTKSKEAVAASDKEKVAEQIHGWEEQLKDRFERERDEEKENEHER